MNRDCAMSFFMDIYFVVLVSLFALFVAQRYSSYSVPYSTQLSVIELFGSDMQNIDHRPSWLSVILHG